MRELGPACIQCHKQTTRRCKPSTKVGEMGIREWRGKRWNWFCGRVCGGTYQGTKHLQSAAMQAGTARFRQQQRQARLQRYIAACKAVMTPEGLVPIRGMVKVLAEVERTWYARGWTARGYYEQTGKKTRSRAA